MEYKEIKTIKYIEIDKPIKYKGMNLEYRFDHANMFTMLLRNFLPKIGLHITYLLEILINMW